MAPKWRTELAWAQPWRPIAGSQSGATMQPLRSFNLGICQMRVVAGDPVHNRAHAAELVAEARRLGADVALLPECCDLGWTDPSSRELAEPIPGGATCRALAAAARESGLYVCAGLVERDGEQVYNAAVLIDP